MKVVILAGGLGTRISEETHIKPKPMVEIGNMPIIWHIMKMYSHHGFKDFIVCLGYKGSYIKDWFNNYFLHNSDVTIDMEKNTIEYHKSRTENWKVTLVDTGSDSMTGGRLKRVQSYIGDERFMMTYGDGVSDVNLTNLVKFHSEHGATATVTVVTPEGRFGVINADSNDTVLSFSEKTDTKNKINGGFFVLEPKVFDYLNDGDATIFEKAPLEKLASEGQLKAYHHSGFWKAMDTLSDKTKLEAMWLQGNAHWMVW